MSLYSSLLLSSIINSSRLYRPHELRFVSVVSAMRIARAVLSVSRSYSSRDASTQKRTTSFKFHFTTTKKKKVKRNERGEQNENASLNNALNNINVPSVSAARITNASLVVFEGEKGSAFMVRRWFKTRSCTFVRFEKNVFFLKVKP